LLEGTDTAFCFVLVGFWICLDESLSSFLTLGSFLSVFFFIFSELLASAAKFVFSFASLSFKAWDSLLSFSRLSFSSFSSFFFFSSLTCLAFSFFSFSTRSAFSLSSFSSFSFLSFSAFSFLSAFSFSRFSFSFSIFSLLSLSFSSFSFLSFSFCSFSFSFSSLSFRSFSSLRSIFSFSSLARFIFNCFFLASLSCLSILRLSLLIIPFDSSFLDSLFWISLGFASSKVVAEHAGYFKHSNFLSFSKPLNILCCGVLPGNNNLVIVSFGFAGCQTNSAQIETRLAIGSHNSFPSTLIPDLKFPRCPPSFSHLDINSFTSLDSLDGLRTYISNFPWPTLW